MKRPLKSAALFFISVAGCSSPPSPEVIPHTKQESAFIAPDIVLKMDDDAQIPLRFYKASSPLRGVILALHGFNDSRDGWEVIASSLNKRGFTIIAPDIRGFGGATPSIRWTSSQRLLSDIREEVLWIHQTYPTSSIFLMGESMGGALALLSAGSTPYLSGIILLSPAIMTLPFPLKYLLTFWNGITPDLLLTESDVPGHHIASDNYHAMRRLYFDPLTRHDTTVHALFGLTELMEKATISLSTAHCPLLVIWGTQDQFVPPESYSLMRKKLPPTTRFDLLENGYHLLSRNRERVGADIASWLLTPDQFLPSGGDITAATWEDFPHNP